MDKPNIVIVGTGRCGTTVLARMLERLGWNLGEVDSEFEEHIGVREINDNSSLRQPKPFAHADAERILESLSPPWCLKDPRFLFTWQEWEPYFRRERVFLVWLTRDIAKTEASFRKQNWGRLQDGVWTSRGKPIAELHELAQAIYESWEFGKLQIDFDDLKAAIGLFDLQRG